MTTSASRYPSDDGIVTIFNNCYHEAIVWSRIMKVLLGDRALHGNHLVARKFEKSRFKNDKMGHFRRPCVNYSQ